MKILLINYTCVFLGLYIFLESLDPISKMGAGLQCFCHKMKYLASLAVAGWVIYFGACLQLNGYFLMMTSTLALFVWPRTVWRLNRLFS